MTKNDFGQDGSIKEFFAFINERQNIYLAKQSGEPAPWTDDPVLRDYFFCNVFREQDKVTTYIREEFREMFMAGEEAELIFNMLLCRFFNYIPTLEHIGAVWHWDRRRKGGIARELVEMQQQGQKIFGEAYLVAGSDLKGKTKIDGVCQRLDFAWKNRKRLAQGIKTDKTLKAAWWWLQEIPGVAGFISYEVVTDLRHTPVLEGAPDIMTWANPGPGAKRGLQRIYGKAGWSAKEYIDAMQILLRKHAARWTDLTLEMRDIEHSLCEYDKYLRIKNGQSKAMRRYRSG